VTDEVFKVNNSKQEKRTEQQTIRM